jgi:hypothetical protein
MTVPLPPVPASGLRIDQMSAPQLWSAYIRYTGAGAVLASGSSRWPARSRRSSRRSVTA